MGEDEALRRLGDVLARPEFRSSSAGSPWDELLAPLWAALIDLLERLGQATDISSPSGRLIQLTVMALAVVLLSGGVVFVVRMVRQTVGRDAQLQGMALAQRRERSDQLWRTAQELAAAGRLGDATRLAYLSALYALDERALLHVEAGLTNREHAGRLRASHPELADAFASVVQLYDGLRYSGTTVTREAFVELSGRVDRARASALGGTAAA